MRLISIRWRAHCLPLWNRPARKKRRRGARKVPPSFSGAGRKLADNVAATATAMARTGQALRRVEAAARRTDTRGWVVQRRERTRHLIELGGIVQKAGLVDLADDDRATLYGAILDLAGRARGEDGGERKRVV